MNDPTPDNLGSRLEALSRPPSEPTAIWRAALDEHRASATRPILRRIAPWAGLAAAIIVVGVMLTPFVGQPPVSRLSAPERLSDDGDFRDETQRRSSESVAALLKAQTADHFGSRPMPASAPFETQAALAPSPRLVARRADLTLRVADVREAFLKAQRVANPALGEFVEDSKIAGEGPAAAADLTLRVTTTRLPAVLDDLRVLGVVISENSAGDDVTEQAVDLDARLRNERAVEAETRGLLESRKDAPLTDVLKLRETLATIRAGIERMEAQRATLTRLVDLATVLVIIRAENAAPPPPPSKGFISELSEHVGIALNRGSQRLAIALARLIESLVGSAHLWFGLLLALPILIGLIRRIARFAFHSLEPAPRL